MDGDDSDGEGDDATFRQRLFLLAQAAAAEVAELDDLEDGDSDLDETARTEAGRGADSGDDDGGVAEARKDVEEGGPRLRMPALQDSLATKAAAAAAASAAPAPPVATGRSRLAQKYAAKPLVDPVPLVRHDPPLLRVPGSPTAQSDSSSSSAPISPLSDSATPAAARGAGLNTTITRISHLLKPTARAAAAAAKATEQMDQEKINSEMVTYTKKQNEQRYTLIPIVPVEEGAVSRTSAPAPTNGTGASGTSEPAAAEDKVLPELVEYTQKQNRDKYANMLPVKNEAYDIENITAVEITGFDKRYDPDKYYVYRIEVHRGAHVSVVFRRYSQFYELYRTLLHDFPNVVHPPFPPKILFGRSHVTNVSRYRMQKLNEYIAAIIEMKDKFAASPVFQTFFRSSALDVDNELFDRKLKQKGIDFDQK